MLHQALDRASAYVDGVLSAYNKHCCCSTDPREDGKNSDVVVFTDWDTKEENSMLGFAGQFSDPAAVRQPPTKSAGCGSDMHPFDNSMGCPGSPKVRDGKEPQQSPRAPKDGAEAASEEALALRELMKRFVQDMIRGKTYLVVVENGRTEPCKLLLTPNLQYLQLEAAGVTHDIPLRNIKDICPGKLLENRFTPIMLDELCNTLVLRNNECVTFRLSSLQERDDFTKCIKVLSLALE